MSFLFFIFPKHVYLSFIRLVDKVGGGKGQKRGGQRAKQKRKARGKQNPKAKIIRIRIISMKKVN